MDINMDFYGFSFEPIHLNNELIHVDPWFEERDSGQRPLRQVGRLRFWTGAPAVGNHGWCSLSWR